MLETIIKSTDGASFTFSNVLVVLLSSVILGLIIGFVYIITHKKEGYSTSFPITLVMLPVIISIIILLVGNNVARAFSLAGAFSIIRFRSAPGNPKDISYVFFTLAVGLALGMGFVGYAVIFTIVLCAVMVLLEYAGFGIPKDNIMKLKITVPEDLNFDKLFDDLLNENSSNWKLINIKTRDFGALYELTYRLNLKDNVDEKKFIDEIRTRNGNLNISLTVDVNDEWK